MTASEPIREVRQEVHLELLLGRPVVNAAGRRIGRIEEVRAGPGGGEDHEDYVVEEYLIGPFGLLERLFDTAAELPVLRALGLGRRLRRHAIPWHQLDLSDPHTPRFVTRIPGAGDQSVGGEHAGERT